MRFGVLGPLAVWADDGRPVPVPESKVRALLVDLLLHEGRPVPVDRIVEDLWGAHPPGSPGNTVQTKVSQLRKALDAGQPGARSLVVWQPSGYALRVEPGAIDVQRFRELTARALATADARGRAALLADALALWRGPALADVAGEPFAAAQAARLGEELLAATEAAAAARLELGEHALLVGELAELIAQHPARESLRALQMRALYRAGRQQEALEAFTGLRGALAAELGIEPGPELVALQGAILRQDPLLDAPGHPRGTLPAPVTQLVGREAAQAGVTAALERSRLVTLVGPGGVGKTSLALEVARGAPDAHLVELAGVERHLCTEEPDVYVADVVAAALDIRQGEIRQEGALPDRIAEVLRPSTALLVLDNCEQVVGAVATLVARLLRSAPGLRILATSQEPLGVAGEVVLAVPPLDLPGSDGLPSVRASGAAALFVERATAAAPGFVLDERTAPAVAAICRRLDGIPLAIELAATRVRALGVHALLRRLDDRFGVLASGRRDAPARHRTLQDMIDWSWQLCTAAEQVVLRRLAVHADGCGLDAAEEVCAGDGVAGSEVLGLLARLVDRSLVVVSEHADVPRYRLLQSVAEFGLRKAGEAGELDALRLQHARFHTGLAAHADDRLRGPDQREWLDRMELEAANMRGALDTAVRAGDADLALRLVAALCWFWFLRGRLGEAQRAAQAALAVPGGDPAVRAQVTAWHDGFAVLAGGAVDTLKPAHDAPLEVSGPAARARWFLGYVLTTIGDMAAGQACTLAAQAAFEELDDRWGLGAAACDRTSQLMSHGERDAAERSARLGAELFDEVGDRWGQVLAAFALGALTSMVGDYPEAERLYTTALRRAEELELWPEVSYQLSWLGRTALLTGDFRRADELHERARRLAVEQGFTTGEMYAQTGLALGARREGRLDDAERHLRYILRWHRSVGFDAGAVLIVAELGFVAEQRGDAATARELHEEGLALARSTGDPRAIALAQEGLAGAHALAGEHAEAARLLDAAARARESVGAPLPQAERFDVDRITAAVRQHVDNDVSAVRER
ncbi:BTAD domain-containing putative transcriptional regulator [Pseudonocardia sp. TRM90224]|uniref:BTAD domain-containing putative transcriptional regulator n=1 Tax=Pseudonocardia sp. TRM90224 TaxID=2812678 RepID=UPI001E5C7A8B|nr:BTAD domain-containing putative transcriptional regulator [Pseudonocardia sp. TRM90224]